MVRSLFVLNKNWLVTCANNEIYADRLIIKKTRQTAHTIKLLDGRRKILLLLLLAGCLLRLCLKLSGGRL